MARRYDVAAAALPIVAALSGMLVPALVFVGIWIFAMRRLGPQSSVMAFGKNRAKIYAEIAGYGATSDGFDMVAPSGEGAVRCMRQARATSE